MLKLLPPLIEPDTWVLAFHRSSPYWWVRLLAFGRYKHVSAFAWVPALRLSVVYDVTLAGTRLELLPESRAADLYLADLVVDADLVEMPARRRRAVLLLPFYCVSAIKHLIGLGCVAATPTGLYRSCLANGGRAIGGSHAENGGDHHLGLDRGAGQLHLP